MRSALILARDPAAADGETELSDARVTADRILRWNLDAELVTLSACETGLGRAQRRRGLPGLLAGPVPGRRPQPGAQPVAGGRHGDGTADDPVLREPAGHAGRDGHADDQGRGAGRGEAMAPGLNPRRCDQLTKDLPTRGTRGKVEPRPKPPRPHAVRNLRPPVLLVGVHPGRRPAVTARPATSSPGVQLPQLLLEHLLHLALGDEDRRHLHPQRLAGLRSGLDPAGRSGRTPPTSAA